jgi:K+ transporter
MSLPGFFTAYKAKIETGAWVIAGLLITAIVIAAVYYKGQNKALVLENHIATNAVNTVVADNKLAASSGAINTEVVASASAADTQLVLDTSDNQVKADQKIAHIQQHYATLPKTASNAAEEAKKVSSVRIDTLWFTFCKSAGASDPSCATSPN